MPTDPARVQAVFLAAADLADPVERAACLDRECAGDAALRSRVEALLRAVDQPDSLLDAPIAPAAGGETKTLPSDPAATQTHGDSAADDVADALAFLGPPGRPDSLGRLGHYEVLEVLGRGGFGIVYRAFDETLQRVVAVKVLAPSMAVTSPARKRFLREAQSAAKIQHENVVRIIEVVEQPLPYLVMEFIAGETLQERLDRTGPLEVPEVLRIGRQIAAGLAAARETGLIHRDIKPSNILIGKGPDEPVKITDFGLARAADDASLTRSGTVAGTPMYMAPEQARGETLDHRADLFSLGSVLYAMLTGRPPFRASSTLAVLKRVAEDDPRPMREVIPEVPDWLCRIVDRLHAKDPAARYQDAREVADVLADCERQLKSHGALRDRSRIPGGRPRRRRFARRWAWAAGLAVAVLLLAGAWVGRPAWLYLTDQGELELVPQDGLVSVIVLQNDEGVFDDNKLHPLMTDWMSMKRAQTLKLPPGKYQLNAGAYPAGTRIIHWEVTTAGAFGSTKRLLPGEGASGWTTIVAVGRGERVSVRAVVVKPVETPSAPQTEVRQEVAGWGTAIDPRGDCTFKSDGDGLVITVPGGKHNLNPTPAFQDVTAPRVLRAAPDNFNLDVKVDAFPVPTPGTSSTGVRSYTGAGPVVWKDAGTFVRFFRAANGETGRVIASVEYYRDGQPQGHQDLDIDNAATWLRVSRNANDLQFWSSTDGEHWAEVPPGVPVRLEGTVEAGVAAVNSTTKPFAPRFSRFELRQGAGEAGGWVPLFNGKDLTGWTTPRARNGGWRVENGILLGTGPDIAQMRSARGDFANFHLRAELRMNSGAVLGVLLRHDASGGTERGYLLHLAGCPGNENTPPLDSSPTTENGKVRNVGHAIAYAPKPFPSDRWFTLEVIAVGGEIVVRADGEEYYRVVHDGAVRGQFGIKMNRPTTRIEFRKIEIKELPATSREVPRRAADMLPFMAGNWKVDMRMVEPKPPPDKVKAIGYQINDYVAGGKFLRVRAAMDDGSTAGVVIYSYDAGRDVLTFRGVWSNGTADDNVLGRFDSSDRSVLWLKKNSNGNQFVHQLKVVDANTITSRSYTQDQSGKVISDLRLTFTRTSSPITLPDLPADPKRPEEAKVLDRLVGDWRTEATVRNPADPDHPTVEPARVKAGPILGGRYVEVFETFERTNTTDYSLVWFDAGAKRYRSWFFSHEGYTLDFNGTWNETAKRLTWNSSDGQLEGRWTFKGADLREYEHLVKSEGGKTFTRASGVLRRVAADSVPPK